MINKYIFTSFSLFMVCFVPETVLGQSVSLEAIKLPPGFRIEIYAPNVPNARSMTMGKDRKLFVGTRTAGKVYAVEDRNGDFRADSVYEIASGLRAPNGVAYLDGSLYIAEIHRVIRFDRVDRFSGTLGKPVIVNDTFPSDASHGWKYMAFGPDGWLYVPVGAPCNVCEKEDRRYATIMRMKPDGSELEVFAEGVRNTVGFDWDPDTLEMWFTDNGRDWLGDDLPPDELNHAPIAGLHFGFPYVHGKDILDPEFGVKLEDRDVLAPAMELGAHVAALGMIFYKGNMFPEKYRGQIFIAEHGSWNRSTPSGYRITLVRFKDPKSVSYDTFAEGWVVHGRAWGRPVDILELTDGSLLISDDHIGVIYRIYYEGP